MTTNEDWPSGLARVLREARERVERAGVQLQRGLEGLRVEPGLGGGPWVEPRGGHAVTPEAGVDPWVERAAAPRGEDAPAGPCWCGQWMFARGQVRAEPAGGGLHMRPGCDPNFGVRSEPLRGEETLPSGAEPVTEHHRPGGAVTHLRDGRSCPCGEGPHGAGWLPPTMRAERETPGLAGPCRDQSWCAGPDSTDGALCLWCRRLVEHRRAVFEPQVPSEPERQWPSPVDLTQYRVAPVPDGIDMECLVSGCAATFLLVGRLTLQDCVTTAKRHHELEHADVERAATRQEETPRDSTGRRRCLNGEGDCSGPDLLEWACPRCTGRAQAEVETLPPRAWIRGSDAPLDQAIALCGRCVGFAPAQLWEHSDIDSGWMGVYEEHLPAWSASRERCTGGGRRITRKRLDKAAAKLAAVLTDPAEPTEPVTAVSPPVGPLFDTEPWLTSSGIKVNVDPTMPPNTIIVQPQDLPSVTITHVGVHDAGAPACPDQAVLDDAVAKGPCAGPGQHNDPWEQCAGCVERTYGDAAEPQSLPQPDPTPDPQEPTLTVQSSIQCRQCTDFVSVTGDGTLATHTVPSDDPSERFPCPGGGTAASEHLSAKGPKIR